MHGITSPEPVHKPTRSHWFGRIKARARVSRTFLIFVVLPTLLVGLYYFALASDQYESEAHFIVRASDESPAVGTGLGQFLSLAGGLSTSHGEALSVSDYLSSHDAVKALQSKDQLVERFQRPEADFLSRLQSSNPEMETLLKYYRKHVDVAFNSDTSITTLRVRTFRPGDSLALINSLLALGEKRVNALNQRAYTDTLAVSRRQLAEAEREVARAQLAMTAFRQNRRDIDPMSSGEAQIRLVSNLTAALSLARAQLGSVAGSLDRSSPQYQALAARVRALEAQVGAQSSRLAGGGRSMATDLGRYEELRLKQDFAAKRYSVAAAAVEKAREQALKQQLFIVRVVEPNLPEKSLYPKRWTITATVFFGLLLTYAVGWLIAAGVREHAS